MNIRPKFWFKEQPKIVTHANTIAEIDLWLMERWLTKIKALTKKYIADLEKVRIERADTP